LNIGGKSCNLTINVLVTNSPVYQSNSIFCANGATTVIDVTNPTTGKTWMDRNLGASQVATSSSDAASFGDLYQWGRRSDGHQCRTSATTTTLSSTNQPGHGNFITNGQGWQSPQNNNLWQGINGINNPCPSNYRIPTSAELFAENDTWNCNCAPGAFASPLKFPLGGTRTGFGDISGSNGHYWSSTLILIDDSIDFLDIEGGASDTDNRARGKSVRCIKN
jgi:hypothetical protein